MATTEQAITEQSAIGSIKSGATMAQVAQIKAPTAKTPDEALELLQKGNARFFSGQPDRTFTDVNLRRSQIIAQTPFAVVLGCADSRVPIELVFDQGPGELFSIRVAGSVVEGATLGSIQYAIKHLNVRLVVVLGHEGCGAVAAALLTPEERASEPLHVRFLLDAIAPAVSNIAHIKDRKAKMREAVILNVQRQREILEEDEVVREAIESGQVKVVGAFYEIGSGAVDFLED